MDITSIDSASLTIGVYAPLAAQSVGSPTDPTTTAPVPDSDGDATSSGSAASVDISKPGQLFSKLKNLETSDPDQFKQVMTDVSNSLKVTAQQDGSTPDGQALSALADKFAQAASSGNLSPLQPAQGHHGHHGHHGHGGQGGQAGAVGAYAGGSPAGASAFAAPAPGTSGQGGVADAVEQAISAALAETTASSSQA